MTDQHDHPIADQLGDALQGAWVAYLEARPSRRPFALERLSGALFAVCASRMRSEGMGAMELDELGWDLVWKLLQYLQKKSPDQVPSISRLARVAAKNHATSHWRSGKRHQLASTEWNFDALLAEDPAVEQSVPALASHTSEEPAPKRAEVQAALGALHHNYQHILRRLYFQDPPDELETLIEEQMQAAKLTSEADRKRIGNNVYKLHERAKLALASKLLGPAGKQEAP